MKQNRAMSPLQGYQPEISTWLWALEDARRRTKEAVADISQEVLDWEGPEDGNTIGTLLFHIAAIETSYLFIDLFPGTWPEVMNDLFPYEDVRDAQGKLVKVAGESLEGHFQRMDTVREHLLDAFKPMSGEWFETVMEREDYTITPRWTLHHLIQHETEHRGQIQLLRLMAERG